MTTTKTKLSDAKRALMQKKLKALREKKAPAREGIGPRPPEAPLELSFAQQRLWFLSQWEPDSPAYNLPNALKLHGPLDVTALQQAVREVVRRHEVLRLTYITQDGEPLLKSNSADAMPWSEVDLRSLAAAEKEAESLRYLKEDAARPFDLAEELPVRATLLRLEEQESLLLLNVHHIATDGWSMGLMFGELGKLYSAFCQGQPSPLEDLAIQYNDFAYWQRNWLQGEVLEKQVNYWRDQLLGAPPVLELPVARPRPPVQTVNGAVERFAFSPELSQAIHALARQVGASPFMTLLAAFQLLLGRYANSDDVVVATPIAGRNRVEIEPLIGFFVNTLVLRTDLSGDPSVRDLLARVRDVTLEAYDNQDLPFEKLVEELHPQRNLSHNPIFQVMFIYHNEPEGKLEMHDLDVDFFYAETHASKFDIKMALSESGEQIRGLLSYNTDLFDAATISGMVQHFEALLTGMTRQPAAPISELALLTPDSRATMLERWCDTAKEHREVQCLHQLFEEQVERTPDEIAVYFEGERYTYAELNANANRMAHYLQTLGVGPDVRVGLYMEKSLDILVALIGILKAGGAYVPLDPLYPPERVRFMLADAGADVLVSTSDLVAELPEREVLKIVCMDSDRQAIAEHSSDNPPLEVGPQNLIYVLFTSGSTGRPKGVAVEHRNYLNYFLGVLPELKVEPGMHYAMVSTFSTDLGTIQFWAPLTTGGTTHIVPYERATDPEAMVDYFRTQRIDVLKLVPSHYDALQGVPDSDDIVPQHLVIFTGEASHWGTVAKVKQLNPQCIVQDHYGVTETTCATLVNVVPDEIPADHAATLPLGKELGNVRVYTLDQHFEPTPPGVPGELCIGGYGVTRGYFGRPGLTAERFVPDPFSAEPGARMYRTGDLAYFRNDGSLKLLGRMDFQIKIRGYRIEAGEIETLLCEQPTVQDAVVMAREDTPGDQRLVAYLVPQPAHAETFPLAELREGLRARLPDYMVPTVFVMLDAIPLNPNGKVDRFKLPVPEYSRVESGVAFVAPSNETEERVAAAWCEVLGLEEVGIDDNFFDVGGESFKAIRVVRAIGEGVSVMDLFRYPTVRELAAMLGDQQMRPRGLLHELTKPVPAYKKKLSLVCVPYGGGSAIVFHPLAEALPKNISLYALQIPGHDPANMAEVPQSIPEVAARCVDEIKRDVSGPVAVYGHCVGAALALEIARCLEAECVPLQGVYLAGAFPTPRMPGKIFEWWNKVFPAEHRRSNRRLYDGLRALGGFAEDMDPVEVTFSINSMRHDMRVAEDFFTWAEAHPEQAKISAPILCVVGERDRMTDLYEERFKDWGLYSDDVDLAVIDQAGHYFLKHQAQDLAALVAEQRAMWQGEKTLVQRSETIAPPEPAVAPSLKAFFLVLLGQFVSLMGSSITSFALGIWVFQRNQSLEELASINTFALVPGILALPFAGALADRWDRRKLMIISDVVAACCTLAMMILVMTGSLQIWHLWITASVSSIAGAFQIPAYRAAITQLVPKQYLGRSAGLIALTSAASRMLAPVLGASLVTLIGLPGIIGIDLLTFVFAVGTLLVIRIPDTLFFQEEESFFQGFIGGFRYIFKRPSMVAMVFFFLIFNYIVGMLGTVREPLVLTISSPEVLGVAAALNGVGMLCGGIIMGLWGGTKRRAVGMVGFCAVYGLSAIIIGLRPEPIFALVGFFGLGISLSILNAHWLALMQSKVGLELQGRVMAVNQMVSWSIMPIGIMTAAPLIEDFIKPLMNSTALGAWGFDEQGFGLLVLACGLSIFVLSLLGYAYRPLRLMEDRLPDAIPDAVIAADKDALQKESDRSLAAA